MNESILFGAADLVTMAQETARTFGFNWPHFISQVISFCIVAFLLHKLAYKPILRVLEERRQRIAEGLANAEKSKAELAAAETRRQEILAQADAQANKLIEEARAAAARVQEQEIQKAVAAAEDIVNKAKEAAAQHHARMLAELRQQVGELVVQTTGKVVGKVLNPEDQRRLTEETSRQLAA